jgi:hypothetical protein
MFGWLFAIILWSAIRVVHHAECLAQKLGEPYGTLILTLSVITIEVMMIATLMLHGSNNPGLARDTMFAVVMIVLNGLVGLSLLLGALRYREQQYNLQGANAYLSVILPLAVLALILPDFTVSTEEPSLSGFQALFLVVMTLALYGTFLAIQTVRHTGYFTVGDAAADDGHGDLGVGSLPFHALLLLAYMLPVVLLAKKIAIPIEYGIETLGLPAALGGLGDCRNETYCMAPDSRSPSRSANSRIVVLCRGWRDKEGGREDKPGGMFHDRNRLSQLGFQLQQRVLQRLLDDRVVEGHFQRPLDGHLLLDGPGEQVRQVFAARPHHGRAQDAPGPRSA